MTARKPNRQRPAATQLPEKPKVVPRVESIKVGNGVPEDVPSEAPIEAFAHRPGNQRYDYDDTTGLATTLETVGQIQAVSVLPRTVYVAHYPEHAMQIGTADWVVMDGNRRLDAARKAGLTSLRLTVDTTLAVVLTSGGDVDVEVRKTTLIANIQREALPPLLEAAELKVLAAHYGGQRALAKEIGRSQPWISQRLALLKLTPDLQADLAAGKLSIEEARSIATPKKDGASQQQELADRREAKAAVKTAESSKNTKASKSTPKAAAAKTGTVAVRMASMSDAADDLVKALSPDQLSELVEKLADHL